MATRPKSTRFFIPGAPLAAAIDKVCRRTPIEFVCELTGLTTRQIYRWRIHETDVSGEHADQVLTGLDLLWWDVWNEDTVRKPLFVVGVYAPQWKNNHRKRTLYRIKKRSIPYGDAGPDWERLAEIEALMTGERLAA